MTTYTWKHLSQMCTYPGIELVMSVIQIAKNPWHRCYRCTDRHIHKYYLVVTVDNVVCYVCRKCLGELGLLQSRYREYMLVIDTYEKVKIYQKRGLSHYNSVYHKTLICVKL